MTTSNNLSITQHAMHITDGLVTNEAAPFIEVLQKWNKGCLELFEWVSQFAVLANKLCEEGSPTKDFPGVFEYEVSCMFGDWLSGRIAYTKTIPTVEEAEQELKNLSAKFFAKT